MYFTLRTFHVSHQEWTTRVYRSFRILSTVSEVTTLTTTEVAPEEDDKMDSNFLFIIILSASLGLVLIVVIVVITCVLTSRARGSKPNKREFNFVFVFLHVHNPSKVCIANIHVFVHSIIMRVHVIIYFVQLLYMYIVNIRVLRGKPISTYTCTCARTCIHVYVHVRVHMPY